MVKKPTYEELERRVQELEQVEKELIKSEQRRRFLINATTSIYWTTNSLGEFVVAQPSWEKYTGQPWPEHKGFGWTKMIHPDDVEHLLKVWRHASQTLSLYDTWGRVWNASFKDYRNFEVRAVPIMDADGSLFEWAGYIIDTTERKQAEKEREQLVAQLHHSHKMESIGTLAGGVAHDFNNLLFMIIGNAELALEEIPQYNSLHQIIDDVKTAGLRAAGIVKQLLNFSRKDIEERKPIGVVSVIRDALKFLRSTIPSNIEIRERLPEEDLVIFADPVQMNQVMMNICINASQAMQQSGGLIAIDLARSVLTEEAVKGQEGMTPREYVKINISDTGPGIDSAILERVFEPYFTTKDVGEGSGMGLAVVHGIINAHGGTISVDSQLGRGTLFTIHLPIAADKAVSKIPAKESIDGGKETILFIDDEKAIVKMIKHILERLGYRVETSMDPNEALKRFKETPNAFDLVITDMTMPHMTGDKLALELMTIRPGIPVILCTGYSRAIARDAANKIGIRAFVNKPIIKSELAKAVRDVLDGINISPKA